MIQWLTFIAELEFEKRCYLSRAAYVWRNTKDCTYRQSRLIWYLHLAKIIYLFQVNNLTASQLNNDKKRKSSFHSFAWIWTADQQDCKQSGYQLIHDDSLM
jgi:hypothetical protein